MSTKKRFSVIFLILILVAALAAFVACDNDTGSSPIVSAVINIMPKTEYYLGDKFDLNGAQLTVTYEDGLTKVVTIDSTMVSEFDSNTLGEQLLTVKYSDVTRYFTVTVKAAPVYSMKVVSTDHKTEYVVGQSFDKKNLQIEVTHTNGYVSTLGENDIADDMISGFNSSAPADNQTVILSYENKSCSYDITVVPKSVVNRELVAPTKKEYYIGDVLDLSGGSMFVAYNDNSEEKLDLNVLFKGGKIGIVIDEEETTKFTKAGSQKAIGLIYDGQRFSFSVIVRESKAEKLVIKNKPNAQIRDSEKFDFSSGVVTATFNNGTTEDINFDDERVTIDSSKCDIKEIGKYKIGVTVAGATIDCEVEVVEPSPESLCIVRPSDEKIYQGKSVDFSDWKYYILLNNGKKETKDGKSEFAVTENMLDGKKLSDFDFGSVGTIKLDFAVKSVDGTTMRATTAVEILAKKIDSLQINNNGKHVYSEGDELSLTGITLTVFYNSGDKTENQSVLSDMIVDKDGKSVNPNKYLEKVGTGTTAKQTIFVKYTDISYDTDCIGSFEVLLAKKATKIELNDKPTQNYVLGETFDLSDWTINITYADGTNGYFNGKDGQLDGEEWQFVFVLGKGTADEKTVTELGDTGKYEIRLVYGGDEKVYLTYNCVVTNEITAVYVDQPFLGFVTEGTSPSLAATNLLALTENNAYNKFALTSSVFGAYVAPEYTLSEDEKYVSAYIEANGSAAFCFIVGQWEEGVANYYVKNDDNGYVKASGEYDENATYYVNVADKYKDNWGEVYRSFYVKDGSRYNVASTTYEETEYYIFNAKMVEFTYKDHDVKTVLSVVPRQIASVEIKDFTSEYDQNGTEWDYSSLRLVVKFDNGTSIGVTGKESGNDLQLTVQNGNVSFTDGRGLKYTVSVNKKDESGAYDFGKFNKLLKSGEIFGFAEIFIKVKDEKNDCYAASEIKTVYIFGELIKEIRFAAGKMSDGKFDEYKDQTVYVNEGKAVKDGFVTDNDGKKIYLKDTSDGAGGAYLCLIGNDGAESYYKINDDKLKTLEIVYSETNLKQRASVRFATRTGSFLLVIRPNVLESIEAEVPKDGLYVVEKTPINADDVKITAHYKDADGNSIEDKTIYLEKTKITGYDTEKDFDFDENGEYKTYITIGYGGKSTDEVALTVKRKTLERITMYQNPNTILYVETPFATEKHFVDDGGRIRAEYNNGESVIINISDAVVTKNVSEFNPNKELSGGTTESQTIYLTYTYFGVSKQTSFVVTITDRKDLTVEYDKSLGADKQFICEYGSGEDLMPLPTIRYYEKFNSSASTVMEKNGSDGDALGRYNISYRDSLGNVSNEWPTDVGTYTVIYSYFAQKGDENNNAFYDDTVTLQITKKAIAIVISDYEFAYGDIIDGDNDTAFVEYKDKSMWKMTAVSNGIADGKAFCYDDTADKVIDEIAFSVYEKNSSSPMQFITSAYGGANKLFVGIGVGEYVIKPVITLKEGNYELSELVKSAEARFVVTKRKIVIAAEDVSKTYGDNEPEYKFRVYDYNVVANAFEGDITQLSATEIFAKNLSSIGEKDGIKYVFGKDQVIYTDVITREYHLARDSADTENVGTDHKIYSGASTSMPNYEVTYAYNNLEIKKAELEIQGSDVERSYGTINLSYKINGKQTSGETFEFYPSSSTPLKNNDKFATLFGDYFNDGEVFYYNAVTKKVTKAVNERYDQWSVLYKNVEFYDSEGNSVGEKLSGFSYEGKEYNGAYTAIPCTTDVGTYYCKVVSDIDLANYDLYFNTNSGYTFAYTISEVKVTINAKSFVVTGSSAIKDQANAANGKRLSAYFVGDGVTVEETNKTEFFAKLDENAKANILSAAYTDKNGNAIEYKLSDDILKGQFTFVRDGENQTQNVGIHKIRASSSGSNFDISLVSVYDEKNVGVPYVRQFYNAWSTMYGAFDVDLDNYKTDAYVVILPEFTQIGYGTNSFEEEANPTFIRKEVYSAKRLNAFGLNAYFTEDAINYTEWNESGVTYALKNKNALYATDTILSAGEYDGTFTYSYFATETKNYINLGDSMVLQNIDYLQIVKYLFDPTYKGDANNKLIFTQKFNYTVDKVQLSVKVDDATKVYDEKDFVPTIEITEGEVCDGDILDLTFDIEVTYIDKDKTTPDEKGLKEYKIGDNTYSSGSFNLLYAGTYSIKVADLGNRNYEFTDGEDASPGGTIEIKPIDIPVYILHKNADKDDTTKFYVTYNIVGNAKNEVDTTWKSTEGQTQYNSYALYKTTDCYIVGSYVNKSGETIDCNLSFLPSNLEITTADENGNYPRTVRRDEDGNVIGYPVRYNINDSEYINYAVVFVDKSGETENGIPQFAEMTDTRYELVIKPKQVKLYNFSQINSKTYDGKKMSLDNGLSKLTIADGYQADKIQPTKLQFTFTRPSESAYIGEGENKYKYLTGDVENNITDVGMLTATARYFDDNDNENYEILFGEAEVLYKNDSKVGICTINPGTVVLNVKTDFLTRQYDGYGLTDPSNTAVTANGATLSPLYKITDALDQMYYKLQVCHYGTDTKTSVEVTEANATEITYSDEKHGYDVGYYWYKLVGVFKDEDGVYHSFTDYDSTATDWFSWNYRFSVKSNPAYDFKDCDGIYAITKRDVYLAVNGDEENGILNVKNDATNAPRLGANNYTYYITYNGFTYQKGKSGEENGKYYYDVYNDINGNGDRFKYAFYVYSGGEFRNVTSDDKLRAYYEGKSEAVKDSGGFDIGSETVYDTNDTLTAGISKFKSAYTNFNFVNATNVNFKVRAREIGIKISLLNIKGNEPKMEFGEEFTSDGGLYFKIEFSEDNYSFTNGIDGYDTNLESIESVITNIINTSYGKLILEGGIGGSTTSVDVYAAINNGQTCEIDGITYVKLGAIDSSWFPANSYDNENQIIDRYYANGTGLNSSSKYSFAITTTAFRITRREIKITGVERDYFNKDTDHYTFVGEANMPMGVSVNDVMAKINSNGKKIGDYIFDNTAINSSVGAWEETESGRIYFVKIPLAQFKSNDSNYNIDTETALESFDENTWDGKSARTSDYVYLPIRINKATVAVNYKFGTLEYGYAIKDEDGTVNYTGLPTLNEDGIYSYPNHAETGVYISEKIDNGPLTAEQSTLKLAVWGAINTALEKIRQRIASSHVKSGEYSVQLKDYIDDATEFANFEIEWGNFTYAIKKKEVTVSMGVQVKAYTVGGTTYDYFSAKWTEKDSFKYGGSNRLAYSVSISQFNLYAKGNGEAYSNKTYTNLAEQIAVLLGAELKEENGSYLFTYKGEEYAGLSKLMEAVCKYDIYEDATGDTLAQSSGVRYIALKGMESTNFALTFKRTPIALYPEIESIGRYKTENEYISIVPDTEAAREGVTVNSVDGTVTGLSLRTCFNFVGVGEDEAQRFRYLDIKATSYDTSAYSGMGYNRTLTVYYDPARSVLNLENGCPSVGDILVVKIVLNESFYNGTSVTTIETNYFAVTIRKTGGNTTGYRETTIQKSDGAKVQISSSDRTENMDEYLESDMATYYLNDGSEKYSSKFDIVNLRVKLLPVVAGSSGRAFEVIIYENALGKLVFGYDGTRNYIRSEYYHCFVQKPSDNYGDMQRYSFEKVTVKDPNDTTTEADVNVGDKVKAYMYYEKIDDVYVLTTDKTFGEDKIYYVAKSDETNGAYVLQSDECEITEDLVNMFDGASHSIGVYIDKVGTLANVEKRHTEDEPIKLEDGPTFQTIRDTFTADRIYTVRVSIDNKSYVFTYKGEPYVYIKSDYITTSSEGDTEKNSDVVFSMPQFFGEAGNTGIDFGSLKVMVQQFAVQNRFIRTATTNNYIADVIFWPDGATDDDTIYITNEGMARTLFEIINAVGNVTISGGEDAMKAYDAPFIDVATKSTVSLSSTITDKEGKEIDFNDLTLLGMYFYNYTARYNYIEVKTEYSVVLYTKTVRLLVTENSVNRLSLNGTAVSSVAPQTLKNVNVLTENLKEQMSETDELTYIFDSVVFDEKNGNSVIMLYFKLSDVGFTDIYNGNSALSEQNTTGVALRIEHSCFNTQDNKWTTKARLIAGLQKKGESRPNTAGTYKGTEREVSFATDASVINILKMSVTRANENQKQEEQLNSDKISDTVLAVRLYQHSSTGTELVFEDYLDRKLTDQTMIESYLLNKESDHYAGVGLDNTSIRLIDFYSGTAVRTSHDYVKYSTAQIGTADNLNGNYARGDAAVTGTGTIYMPTDMYDVPLSYKGNAINFRFGISSDEAYASTTDVVRFYFGMNTPYWVNYGASIDLLNSSLRKQRGLYFEYNLHENKLYFSFYKYSLIFDKYKEVSLDSINLNDGNEHQITAEIDFSTCSSTGDKDQIKHYWHTLYLYIDGQKIDEKLYVPAENDLSGYGYFHIANSSVSYGADAEKDKDSFFIRGINYSAVEATGGAKVTVKDIIGYQQNYATLR